MELDKDNIRFDLNTPAIDVVNGPNFFNMNVVANNVEIPIGLLPPPGLICGTL